MKKKAATIFTIAMLMFVPSTAKADIDVISDIERVINAITEKINMVVKQYNTIQANLQGLSLNRNIVSQLRDKVKSELKSRAMQAYGEIKDMAMAEGMMFLKTSLSSISLPGLSQYVDLGAFVNPKLKVAVGQTYLKRQHQNDDVKYIATMDKRNNDLMVDNAAILFANSLVRRVQLIEEDPCHCVDDNNNLIPGMPNCTNTEASACKENRDRIENLADVQSAEQMYYNTVMDGHNHWLKIKEARSMYSKMMAEGLLNQGIMDDVGDVTGVIDDTAQEERANEAAVNELMEKARKAREANTLELSNRIGSILGDIKNGNITDAVANTMQNAADVYGGAPGSWKGVTSAMQGAAVGARAVGDAQNGNWGAALNTTAAGAGAIISSSGNADIGSAFSNAAGGSGAALNDALNGNWGGAIRNSSGAAGGVVGNEVDGVLGATIGSAGSLTDMGINAVNSGGDWNDYINNTIGSGQFQGAVGNIGNAYENSMQQEEQWQNAVDAVRQQQQDQVREGLDELMKKEKQERCSRCNAENDELIKAGKPMKSCVSECS